ncbi:MAG: hypothetical protein HYY55_04505 [Candidatus Niyogibacteria bacterium]|nr:MAG: hypothetical protein HYY55_04505 [Candidatus Niyogibacteria bacterium]
MNSETKTCQSCKSDFVVESDDFEFYEKIKVPAPTWCPKCRLQRRLSFWNLVNLHKRKCDLCGKDTISNISPDKPFKVYCPDCWWSDRWDVYEYGRDYDFSKPFFEQWSGLFHEAPLLGLAIDVDIVKDSPYNNNAGHLKNCYLLFHAVYNKDSAYGAVLVYNESVMDCAFMHTNELLYDCMHHHKCSKCAGSRWQAIESRECFFCRDIINCHNCFASANLRNKKYYIFNKSYSKEDYFKEIAKYDLGSYKTYQEIKKLAEEHWRKFPPRPKYDNFSVNSTGDFVFYSKNCKECFEVVDTEDSKFMFLVSDGPVRDCYDISASWGNNFSLSYESVISGNHTSGVRFCQGVGMGIQNAEYSHHSLLKGSNHFGCVSMKGGDYVILNKRYSKNEFEKLRGEVIKHMDDMPYIDKKGRVYKYGEFFPPELSVFGYNETIAQSAFPLAKKEAEEQGYRWRDEDKKEYKTTKKVSDIPDHIKNAGDDILQEIIECQKCAKGYKIIPMELKFLREMNFPLPRECPICRINEKFSSHIRGLHILKRKCSKCGAGFETSHPEDEIPYILCKECYQESLE